jgi:hypothetical protein
MADRIGLGFGDSRRMGSGTIKPARSKIDPDNSLSNAAWFMGRLCLSEN